MMEPGGVSAVIVPDGYLFPVEIDADQMTYYRWLIRAWKINVTYHAPAGGSFDDETGSAEIIHTSQASSEDDLGDQLPPSFNDTTVTGTRTLDDGVNPPVVSAWNPGTSLLVCDRASDFIPPDAPDLNNYYFNSASLLYLPRVEFQINPVEATSFILGTNFVQADDANVNTSIQEFSGTWDGQPITIQLLTTNSHPLDDFTFTAVRYRYWTYTGASGAIWDAVTGAEASPGAHSTTED